MDKEQIREKADEYLDLLGELKKKTGDERIAMNILQEVNKDLRMAQIREEKSNGNGSSQFASEKQKQYLQKLGVEAPAGLSKLEASRLIDEAKEKESEEDSFLYVEQNVPSTWHNVAWA